MLESCFYTFSSWWLEISRGYKSGLFFLFFLEIQLRHCTASIVPKMCSSHKLHHLCCHLDPFHLCSHLGQLRIIKCQQHPLHPIKSVAPRRLQRKYSLARTSSTLHRPFLGCKVLSGRWTAHNNRKQWCRTCTSTQEYQQAKILWEYTRSFYLYCSWDLILNTMLLNTTRSRYGWTGKQSNWRQIMLSSETFF